VKIEARETFGIKSVVLIPETTTESKIIDKFLGDRVPVDISGQVKLSDGYGDHYISLYNKDIQTKYLWHPWDDTLNIYREPFLLPNDWIHPSISQITSKPVYFWSAPVQCEEALQLIKGSRTDLDECRLDQVILLNTDPTKGSYLEVVLSPPLLTS
jgi:hypothetical protein